MTTQNHNLEQFNQSQQRLKARQSQAQNTGNTIAAIATANADTSENEGLIMFNRDLLPNPQAYELKRKKKQRP